MKSLKPSLFHGGALPRPRYHSNDSETTDPPAPVNDSLLRWSKDAQWSMGGVSSKRRRMQGKIEGRLKKLRDESEDSEDDISKNTTGKSTEASEAEGRVKGRKGTRSTFTRATTPDMPWGEEDEPSPLRISMRQCTASPAQTVPVVELLSSSSEDDHSPVRRGESAAEGSDAEVGFEDDIRFRDAHTRRSSRVTAPRRISRR